MCAAARAATKKRLVDRGARALTRRGVFGFGGEHVVCGIQPCGDDGCDAGDAVESVGDAGWGEELCVGADAELFAAQQWAAAVAFAAGTFFVWVWVGDGVECFEIEVWGEGPVQPGNNRIAL